MKLSQGRIQRFFLGLSFDEASGPAMRVLACGRNRSAGPSSMMDITRRWKKAIRRAFYPGCMNEVEEESRGFAFEARRWGWK